MVTINAVVYSARCPCLRIKKSRDMITGTSDPSKSGKQVMEDGDLVKDQLEGIFAEA